MYLNIGIESIYLYLIPDLFLLISALSMLLSFCFLFFCFLGVYFISLALWDCVLLFLPVITFNFTNSQTCMFYFIKINNEVVPNVYVHTERKCYHIFTYSPILLLDLPVILFKFWPCLTLINYYPHNVFFSFFFEPYLHCFIVVLKILF